MICLNRAKHYAPKDCHGQACNTLRVDEIKVGFTHLLVFLPNYCSIITTI
jgi:hypothetical protein